MAPTFTVRKSNDRGYANLGWLDTHHTFSFANYYDPKFDGFGSLRVLNEDRVEPGKGFGTHPHREYEIFSYVVSGDLEHKDSTGNHEVIHRGDVQFTTAGTGIAHSEYNGSKTKPVHFLQIWNMPYNRRLPPGYATGHFPDTTKQNRFATLIAPAEKRDHVDPGHADAEKPIAIHSDFWMSAALVDEGKTATYRTPKVVEGESETDHAAPRKLYLHVVQNNAKAKVTVKSQGAEATLTHGDGMFVTGFHDELVVANEASGVAEVVLIDLA
ncbi:Pirin-domain-containing protein [Gonapodya prolifera JEL478]|uniref:Pirin-domain-containing protein n=1 Tax=Gonapodya prolifera (strain JEL478) TaxID=1344416 RepID=A0A139A0V2_GONPJ|nr:Pirin-domain-containing protein [Gonapodya prolifera JEL478]|eukprot:KXS10391.1 Pirin-domain-containing protein [Gonapodya prolifera JEL478]